MRREGIDLGSARLCMAFLLILESVGVYLRFPSVWLSLSPGFLLAPGKAGKAIAGLSEKREKVGEELGLERRGLGKLEADVPP